MKALKFLYASIGFFILALIFVQCQKEELIMEDETQLVEITNTKLPEVFDNNLSFPVIWSDGYELKLRDNLNNEIQLEGEWWYVWGDDVTLPTELVCSCKPHPVRHYLCENGRKPGDGYTTVYKAYLQKERNNIWQAGNTKTEGNPLYVDLVDWEDGLEIKDWALDSEIPTQLLLYENLNIPMLQFSMKHVKGWGVDEVQGLKTTLSDLIILESGEIASVYSHNVRFTIQKLNVCRDSIPRGSLIWEPVNGWTETDPNGENIINEPIMNQPVYETNIGPDYFNAAVNTFGKVVYEYNWDVSQLNEGEGYYRLTYSFDENCGEVPLNTYFDENTRIMEPNQKSNLFPLNGGQAKLDLDNNLTFMDICVKQTIVGEK